MSEAEVIMTGHRPSWRSPAEAHGMIAAIYETKSTEPPRRT